MKRAGGGATYKGLETRRMTTAIEDFGAVITRPLCVADITLEKDAPIALGRSPWRNRRVSYIGGGTVTGDRVRGVVCAGGGDWSELGVDEAGDALTLIDVRSLWRTHDDADIYVTYQGRLVIPKDVLGVFRNPDEVERLDPQRYYFRVTPVFETADPRYGWLNRTVAIGLGRRTGAGVRYTIFEIC